jgi:hypothetical protein
VAAALLLTERTGARAAGWVLLGVLLVNGILVAGTRTWVAVEDAVEANRAVAALERSGTDVVMFQGPFAGNERLLERKGLRVREVGSPDQLPCQPVEFLRLSVSPEVCSGGS